MSQKTLQFCAKLETHLDKHLQFDDDDDLLANTAKVGAAGAGLAGAGAVGMGAHALIKDRMSGMKSTLGAEDPFFAKSKLGQYASAAGSLGSDAVNAVKTDGLGAVTAGASKLGGAIKSAGLANWAKIKALLRPAAKTVLASSRARTLRLAAACDLIELGKGAKIAAGVGGVGVAAALTSHVIHSSRKQTAWRKKAGANDVLEIGKDLYVDKHGAMYPGEHPRVKTANITRE